MKVYKISLEVFEISDDNFIKKLLWGQATESGDLKWVVSAFKNDLKEFLKKVK